MRCVHPRCRTRAELLGLAGRRARIGAGLSFMRALIVEDDKTLPSSWRTACTRRLRGGRGRRWRARPCARGGSTARRRHRRSGPARPRRPFTDRRAAPARRARAGADPQRAPHRGRSRARSAGRRRRLPHEALRLSRAARARAGAREAIDGDRRTNKVGGRRPDARPAVAPRTGGHRAAAEIRCSNT
jgi:hypothetical protein